MSNNKLVIESHFNLLVRNHIFEGLDIENMKLALSLFRANTKSYLKGEYLHSAHSKLEYFGFVLSGSVQACINDIDGNRMIMAQVVPGKTFGEALCFLEITDSPVYIFASENAEVLWLNPSGIYNRNDTFSKSLQIRFASMLAYRTLSMNDRIQILSKLNLRDKILTFLNQMAVASNSLSFQITMTREDLAAYISSDRSALSRELSKMKREGIIDYYRNSFKLIK